MSGGEGAPPCGVWWRFGETMAALARMEASASPTDVKEIPMKKIQVRKAGPVRLTSSACDVYTNPS